MPVYEDTEKDRLERGEPVHGSFGLSYASYYVVPRSVLQSMPLEWQDRFIELANQLVEHFGDTVDQVDYRVVAYEKGTVAKGRRGRIVVKDPLRDYRHVRLDPDVPFVKRPVAEPTTEEVTPVFGSVPSADQIRAAADRIYDRFKDGLYADPHGYWLVSVLYAADRVIVYLRHPVGEELMNECRRLAGDVPIDFTVTGGFQLCDAKSSEGDAS